ncbi:Protein kinase domain protein [Mycena sanguinolenta]|uniref:Protein kinase domain protein n=1 Tax=Mycena sanguinolenta TaxID=230812 RepID=A0A8H7DGH0_9AGAR|nr:Protein kinase domain protein [Mycena sanguinolenta]
MKFSTSFIALVAAMLSQTAAATSIDTTATDECGALGVMQIPDVLPDGVSRTDFRKCASHPFEVNGTRINHDGTLGLVARAADTCETASPYGCTVSNGVGYCWKVCGSGGQWCWTASNYGAGPWDTCNTFKDCGIDNAAFGCGVGCSQPSQCGCSC